MSKEKCKKCNNTGAIVTVYRDGHEDIDLCECEYNPYKQRQTTKVGNEKLNKLHAFLHNKFNWSKEDVWIRNYLSSYIFDEEMVSDGKEYISPIKQISDLTQQNKQMREALEKIRSYELQSLDIDWDEYEVRCRETDYSPIITYCEIGLGEQDVI